MAPRLTVKQEKFVLYLFKGMNQREAYVKAGYAFKSSLAVMDANASRLANSEKVLKRLIELRQKAEDASVASVIERKQILTEIARGRITDYQEAGADGSGYINIGKESPNTASIAGIESATKFDENGNTGTLFTKVRLHSPTQAIDLLNKMERIYDDAPKINIQMNQVVVKHGDIPESTITESIAIMLKAGVITIPGNNAGENQR